MSTLLELLLPYIIEKLSIRYDGLIDWLKGNSELEDLISNALRNAETRAKNDVNDEELVEWATILPLFEIPNKKIINAIRQFAQRPYDDELSRAICEEMSHTWRKIPYEKIKDFSLLYVKYLREELALAIPEFREKIQILANLKTIDGYNISRKEEIIMGDKIEISGVVGFLNTGEIKNVESIDVNVSAIDTSGNHEIATAIKEITEAVVKNGDIEKQQRAEVLELLQEISKQAALPPKERASKSIIKSVLATVATTIGTVSGVAQIWSTWGEKISKFFGL